MPEQPSRRLLLRLLRALTGSGIESQDRPGVVHDDRWKEIRVDHLMHVARGRQNPLPVRERWPVDLRSCGRLSPCGHATADRRRGFSHKSVPLRVRAIEYRTNQILANRTILHLASSVPLTHGDERIINNSYPGYRERTDLFRLLTDTSIKKKQ